MKIDVLDHGFIELVDHMGNDYTIVQAARTSYGNEDQQASDKDRRLIRRLMKDGHTSPFEMVEFMFRVQVPMDCWRQWIRHRTANVNEYSTRYSEALDMQQCTPPDKWRLQAKDNKQGSSGYMVDDHEEFLSRREKDLHQISRDIYQERLALGIAKEQARKDLPLSTYTRAYWKCDLHNIFNFLRLRLDKHAQEEIRLYAEAIAKIVKSIVPVAYEAFEDYVLHAVKFSKMEIEVLKHFAIDDEFVLAVNNNQIQKPDTMTENEWKEFLKKIS